MTSAGNIADALINPDTGLGFNAARIERAIGVKAERKSLESVAAPLTAIRQETGATATPS